ncbi:ketoacyl-ACP synthase III family protein [Antrihabitans cavernicola]|uniref:3-oxoacyl-ACP synthase n=1 Tax=Antrihabitans cavernicola TaxID=2495913 RepID=A0A5A7SF06_9NOCA|nr:ketoacyl-ACP synthase III family protein [Spelaeibacter cavernicola]KAA0024164.1 hypothetical protein FOY51_06340 [Spelaeibacter cavernicola]
MLFDNEVWVTGASAWIPPGRDTAEAAVARGQIDTESAGWKATDLLGIAADVSGPEMAIQASKSCLASAGRAASDIDFLIYSWIYYQGHDLWSVAHYVANEIGAVNCLPMTIHQGCEGGVLALQDAALRLNADPTVHTAMVTAADRFVLPGVDRWNNQEVYVLGDGGSAIVLSNEPTRGYRLRIVSVCTQAVTAFNIFTRGDRAFADVPMGNGSPTQLADSDWNMAFESVGGRPEFIKISQQKVRAAFDQAIEEAGIAPEELELIVLPRWSARATDRIYESILEEFATKEIVSFYSETGHLGPADCGADLARIMDDQLLTAARFGALLGVGGGFTWTCTIVQACAD